MNADLANDLGNLAQRSLSMVAKNCDGAVPRPARRRRRRPRISRCSPRRRACRRGARAHGGLPISPLSSARCSRSSPRRTAISPTPSPGGSHKTDPARMRVVLYVTIETLRVAAILLQPVMPASMGKLLDLLGVAPEARTFARSASWRERRAGSKRRTGCRPGSGAARARRRSFRAMSSRRPTVAVTLIDSHCHLDFPDFADELDAVVARAARGGRRADDDDRHAGRMRGAARRDRRALTECVYFTVGAHPHEAAAAAESDLRGDAPLRRPSEMRRHRRGGARLSLQLRAARCRHSAFSAPRSGLRARSRCRSSSIPARPTTTWRRS